MNESEAVGYGDRGKEVPVYVSTGNNKQRREELNPKCYCRTVGEFYQIRVNKQGNAYSPFEVIPQPIEEYFFEFVTKEQFDFYINFLTTQNTRYLSYCNRGIQNG